MKETQWPLLWAVLSSTIYRTSVRIKTLRAHMALKVRVVRCPWEKVSDRLTSIEAIQIVRESRLSSSMWLQSSWVSIGTLQVIEIYSETSSMVLFKWALGAVWQPKNRLCRTFRAQDSSRLRHWAIGGRRRSSQLVLLCHRALLPRRWLPHPASNRTMRATTHSMRKQSNHLSILRNSIICHATRKLQLWWELPILMWRQRKLLVVAFPSWL